MGVGTQGSDLVGSLRFATIIWEKLIFSSSPVLVLPDLAAELARRKGLVRLAGWFGLGWARLFCIGLVCGLCGLLGLFWFVLVCFGLVCPVVGVWVSFVWLVCLLFGWFARVGLGCPLCWLVCPGWLGLPWFGWLPLVGRLVVWLVVRLGSSIVVQTAQLVWCILGLDLPLIPVFSACCFSCSDTQPDSSFSARAMNKCLRFIFSTEHCLCACLRCLRSFCGPFAHNFCSSR